VWRAPGNHRTQIKHAARLARPGAGAFFPLLAAFVRNVPVPLDEFLPNYHFNEIHSTRVAAEPREVLGAARAVTAREVPLLVALMALRRLPVALRRRRLAPLRRSLDAPLLGQFTGGGFVVLADRPHEFVLGIVGRFWAADSGVRPIGAEEFAAFDAPGFAKAAMSFHTRAAGGGTVLTTETRIQGTDEHARRSFGRYWRVIMPGSALIRRAWLRAIRKRAERA
jgi:hypothetical protein